MYLRTIYELVEEGIVPLRARIAERLHQSGPTVSQTVARMERDGLVTVEGDRHLELTPEGQRLATRVMRKHRLAERLLTDVIGLDWELVHAEACRWEHVMSETVERRLVDLLGHPTESPYGNPIPGLGELGEAGPATEFLAGTELLADLAGEEKASVRVRRISEELQKDEPLMGTLRRVGALNWSHIWKPQIKPRADKVYAPKPKTVRGVYTVVGDASDGSIGTDISFGWSFDSNPTIHYIFNGDTPPAACPGNVTSPKAK